MPMSVLSLFEPGGLLLDPRQAQPRDGGYDEGLFAQIAEQLRTRGFSVNPAAVPLDVVQPLQQHVFGMEAEKFSAAGIGRGTGLAKLGADSTAVSQQAAPSGPVLILKSFLALCARGLLQTP